MGFCNCSMFCCALLCVHSSFATISMGKRERTGCFALFVLFVSHDCWLFLTMPWVCLQFVIVVLPDHTHFFGKCSVATYLSITIADNMDWGHHISEISSKATKTLGFLRKNFAFTTMSIKGVACKTLVFSLN